MVSVLVQRQQREAAMRKKRLLAARQAAAVLSTQQARAYRKQKRQQEVCVREDARQLWLQSHAHDVAVIDGLVARAATEHGEAQEAASRQEAKLQMEACREAAAWQAERRLEAARHRLAVAFTRTEAHRQTKPAREAEQRRAGVRMTEKARAARVAAAVPAARSLWSVLGSMQAAPVATHVPHAGVPVPQPSRESLRAAATSADGADPADVLPAAQLSPRRWRISQIAPHVRVTLNGAPTRCGTDHEEGEISAPAAADDVVPASADAYAEECAAAQEQRTEMLKEGQERAAQRAATVLRHQHAKDRLQQEEEQAHRKRLAAVKAHYRNPREEGATHGDTHTAITTAGGGGANSPLNHQPRRSRSQRAPQQPTRHQQAYLKGEEEFRAAFVEAPPVVVLLDEQPPRRAPLSNLLRPVKVAELLYSIAHPVLADATPLTPSSNDRSGAAAAARPPAFPKRGELSPSVRHSSRARVLPSVPLHMLPFDYHGSAACATAESAPADRSAATAPLSSNEGGCASPPPVLRGPSDTRSHSLHASAEASAVLSTMQGNAPVSPESPQRTLSPEKTVAAEELVALSPLTPAPRDASARVPESPSTPPPYSGDALTELGQAAPSIGTSDAPMAYRQEPLEVPGGTCATSAGANASVSSSMTERTPVRHRHRCRATPPSLLPSSSAATTETAEPASASSSTYSVGDSSSSSRSVNPSTANDSTSSGESSRYRMPGMTAEQLKLALLRLRSRIKSARI